MNIDNICEKLMITFDVGRQIKIDLNYIKTYKNTTQKFQEEYRIYQKVLQEIITNRNKVFTNCEYNKKIKQLGIVFGVNITGDYLSDIINILINKIDFLEREFIIN